jgi:murein hydrolase activator
MQKFFFTSFFLLFTYFVYSQKVKSRAVLEREKKASLAKILSMNKVLGSTQKAKVGTLNEINTLNTQILNQENTIGLAKDEISLIGDEMAELDSAQVDLSRQLQSLRAEYAETLFKTSKTSYKITKLSFLFSATSLNNLFVRYKYLEQYTDSRKQQLAQIKKISQVFRERQTSLINKKLKQQTLVQSLRLENRKLGDLKVKQGQVLASLNEKEAQLKIELSKSKASLNELNLLINRIIENNLATKRKAIELKKTKKEPSRDLTPKTEEITKEENSVTNTTEIVEAKKTTKSTFGGYKAKLPWPVEGFVSDRFGIKNHPVLKGLKIENNGIDIQTSPNAVVSSVFEGTVLDISQISGLNAVIAIQHGDFFTVYANLKHVQVEINQTVKARQALGVASEKDGVYEINFQIWRNFSKLNPEPWLR